MSEPTAPDPSKRLVADPTTGEIRELPDEEPAAETPVTAIVLAWAPSSVKGHDDEGDESDESDPPKRRRRR